MKKSILFSLLTLAFISISATSCTKTAMMVYQQPPAVTLMYSYIKEVPSNHLKFSVTPFVDPSAGERYVGQTISLAYCTNSTASLLQRGVHQYAANIGGLCVTLVRDETPNRIEWKTDVNTGERYQAKYYNWQITGSPWSIL